MGGQGVLGGTRVELGMHRGWWLPQDTRLRSEGVRGLCGWEPWGLRCEEVWVLKWKRLLVGLGPTKGGSWDVRLRLRMRLRLRVRLKLRLRRRPHPWRWKTCDPGRKVLGRRCCEGLLSS